MAATNTQFSIAIHLLVGIGSSGEGMTSATLAESVNAYPSFVRRILAKLSKAGLVRTTTGKTGSTALARSPAEISLLDIYTAVEPPKAFAIHTYPAQKSCLVSCKIKPALERVLTRAQQSLEDNLQATTLSQVMTDLRKG